MDSPQVQPAASAATEPEQRAPMSLLAVLSLTAALLVAPWTVATFLTVAELGSQLIP